MDEGLNQIRRSIESVNRSLPEMERNLGREFQSAIKSIPRSPGGYGQGSPVPHPTRRPLPPQPRDEWNWPFIIPAALILVTLIGVAGYFLYRWLAA